MKKDIADCDKHNTCLLLISCSLFFIYLSIVSCLMLDFWNKKSINNAVLSQKTPSIYFDALQNLQVLSANTNNYLKLIQEHENEQIAIMNTQIIKDNNNYNQINHPTQILSLNSQMQIKNQQNEILKLVQELKNFIEIINIKLSTLSGYKTKLWLDFKSLESQYNTLVSSYQTQINSFSQQYQNTNFNNNNYQSFFLLTQMQNLFSGFSPVNYNFAKVDIFTSESLSLYGLLNFHYHMININNDINIKVVVDNNAILQYSTSSKSIYTDILSFDFLDNKNNKIQLGQNYLFSLSENINDNYQYIFFKNYFIILSLNESSIDKLLLFIPIQNTGYTFNVISYDLNNKQTVQQNISEINNSNLANLQIKLNNNIVCNNTNFSIFSSNNFLLWRNEKYSIIFYWNTTNQNLKCIIAGPNQKFYTDIAIEDLSNLINENVESFANISALQLQKLQNLQVSFILSYLYEKNKINLSL